MEKKLNLLILSEDRAMKYQPTGKAVVIRMLEPEEEYKPLSGCYAKELCIPVHDITPSPYNPSNFILFSSKHVKQLISFFREITKDQDLEELIIHCHAGISRSAAVAISYAWFIGDSALENNILTSRKYVPNPHILTCMANEMEIAKEKENILQRFLDDEIEEADILF